MKKVILAAAALLVSVSAFGQSFDWGVKAGLNLADVSKAEGSKMKPSVYAGVFAEFNLVSDLLSIQPEVVYSRQGWDMKNDGIKTHVRLNYLNVPVIFKLYMIENLSLDLGPQFGFLLNAAAKAKDGDVKVKEDLDGFKNFDVSMGMGLSYKFMDMMDVTARYNLGLTKLVDDVKAKNNVIQIGLGYRF